MSNREPVIIADGYSDPRDQIIRDGYEEPTYGATTYQPTYGAMPYKYLKAQSTTKVEYIQAEKPSVPIWHRLVQWCEYHPLVLPCVCEFFGTFALAYVVACCPVGPFLPTALAAIYTALIYTVGLISGAHLNPAISLAAVVVKKTMSWATFFVYFVSQVAGGVLGGLFFRFCFGMTPLATPIFSFGDAILVELVFTSMLVFVSLNVTMAVCMNRNQFYGIAVGFVIVAGGYVSLKLSGGVLFNPALCFGLGLSSFNLGTFVYGCWYALAELGGGLIAALLFLICRHNEFSIAHEICYEVEHGHYQNPHEVTMVPSPSFPARVFSEFLGTFWVVVTFGLNAVLSTEAIAWSVGATLLSMTYALSSVSGAHFNPAVTLAVTLSGRGKCPWKDSMWYIVAQLVSAIPAGLVFASAIPKAHNVTPFANMSMNTTNLTEIGLFIDYSSYDWYEIGVTEVLFTAFITYVVLVVSTSEMHVLIAARSWPNFYFGLAIGFAFVGACFAAAPISGGYLNPAVALGFAVEGQPSFEASTVIQGWPWIANSIIRFIVSTVNFFRYYLRIFWYIIPEFLGAGLAAAIFRLTHAVEYGKAI